MTAASRRRCRRSTSASPAMTAASPRYRLGTSGRPLAPGEAFAFSSRLDVPKNGVKSVSVTFGE